MAYKDKADELACKRRSYHRQTPEQRERRNARLRAAAKVWYRKPGNKEKIQARQAVWRAKNQKWNKFIDNLSNYKLTLDQYHAIFERQDFLCAICRADEKLVVDHCHRTGKVRGLLCRTCNGGLGFFRESQEALLSSIGYLQKHAA